MMQFGENVGPDRPCYDLFSVEEKPINNQHFMINYDQSLIGGAKLLSQSANLLFVSLESLFYMHNNYYPKLWLTHNYVHVSCLPRNAQSPCELKLVTWVTLLSDP